jgi:starch synthase
VRILFATSEAFPLIKTGGLADVSGSLPAALRHLGQDVRLLIPGYRQVFEKLHNPRVLLELDGMADPISIQKGTTGSTTRCVSAFFHAWLQF